MMRKLLIVLFLLGLSGSAWGQTYQANVTLTIDNTAAGVSFTASDITGTGHPQVTSASCTSNSAGGTFRYKVDGTAPTTSVGVEVPAGGALIFGDTAALLAFKGIRTGGTSAVLNCTLSGGISSLPGIYPVGASGTAGGGGSGCPGTAGTPCVVVGGDSAGSPTAGTVLAVQGIASGTNLNVNCAAGCVSATSDPDDGSIAVGQTNTNSNALNMAYDGSVWRRLQFGTAGSASTQVFTVQGIASMTPLLVGDGVGAFNVIVDSGTVTSVNQFNGQAISMGTGIRDAGTQRVTIATNDVVPASQSGTWTVQPGNTANSTPWLFAGGLTANGAASAGNRLGTLPGIVQTSAPTLTDGRDAALSLTTGGAARMMITNAAGAAQTIATDATHDSAASSTGPQQLAAAAADGSLPAAVTAGDGVRVAANLNGVVYTRAIDPCSGEAKTYYVVNVAASGTVEIANAVASEFFYICSVNLVTASANNVLIAEDDTDGCGSVSAGLNGGTTAGSGWNFAANGGIALGDGSSTVMKTATANRYFCLLTSASVQLSGTIAYVSAP